MRTKTWIPTMVLFLFLASCNLPTSGTSTTQPADVQLVSNVDTVGTAAESPEAAKLTEVTGSAEPLTATFTPSPTPIPTFTPTPCNASVTAMVNANVRSGPDTAYDITGALMLGQSADVSGRNDANTWWYIDSTAVYGGHGWIAGSVVSTSCLPHAVQVVAAPPLPPTKVPTAVPMEPTRVPTLVPMRPTRVPTTVLWWPTIVPTNP